MTYTAHGHYIYGTEVKEPQPDIAEVCPGRYSCILCQEEFDKAREETVSVTNGRSHWKSEECTKRYDCRHCFGPQPTDADYQNSRLYTSTELQRILDSTDE